MHQNCTLGKSADHTRIFSVNTWKIRVLFTDSLGVQSWRTVYHHQEFWRRTSQNSKKENIRNRRRGSQMKKKPVV